MCGTKMFLQCSGRLQRDCDDFLRGSKLSVALKPLNINVPLLDAVEDPVKLLRCPNIIRLVLQYRQKNRRTISTPRHKNSL